MRQNIKAKIFGRVQGVGFRFNAKKQAERKNIAGWIRNARDGSVEMGAEGDQKDLKDFLDWCRSGPEGAKVEKIEYEHQQSQGWSDFRILY